MLKSIGLEQNWDIPMHTSLQMDIVPLRTTYAYGCLANCEFINYYIISI